ncbi:MAG: hypothetical protein VKM34_11680 [Cyanobacteriota bacterium]|nr:hypothetical protein [Cyanobacteriota bacterium]
MRQAPRISLSGRSYSGAAIPGLVIDLEPIGVEWGCCRHPFAGCGREA